MANMFVTPEVLKLSAKYNQFIIKYMQDNPRQGLESPMPRHVAVELRRSCCNCVAGAVQKTQSLIAARLGPRTNLSAIIRDEIVDYLALHSHLNKLETYEFEEIFLLLDSLKAWLAKENFVPSEAEALKCVMTELLAFVVKKSVFINNASDLDDYLNDNSAIIGPERNKLVCALAEKRFNKINSAIPMNTITQEFLPLMDKGTDKIGLRGFRNDMIKLFDYCDFSNNSHQEIKSFCLSLIDFLTIEDANEVPKKILLDAKIILPVVVEVERRSNSKDKDLPDMFEGLRKHVKQLALNR